MFRQRGGSIIQDQKGITNEERVAVLTTNPKTLYNNYTLLKNENVLEALESYEKHKFNGANPPTAFVRARIRNLFRHIKEDLRRNLPKETYEEIKQHIEGGTLNEALHTYEEHIQPFLADIGLFSTAKAREYDVQNVPEEDEAKGL